MVVKVKGALLLHLLWRHSFFFIPLCPCVHVCVFEKPGCVRAENNWTTACVRWRRRGEKQKVQRLGRVYFLMRNKPTALFCRSNFSCLSLMSPFEVTLVASCFCTPQIVAPITQTQQHMDLFVKINRKKNTSRSHFSPLQNKEIIVRGRTAPKRTLNVCPIHANFSWRFTFLLLSTEADLWVCVWSLLMQGETWLAVLQGKKKKNIRGKGWKSYWTCTLMGEQIPSKLAASRREFHAALDDSQTGEAIRGDEKRETRELGGERIQIGGERWKERENKEEDMTKQHHVLFLSQCVSCTVLVSFKIPSLVTLAVSVFTSPPSSPSLLQQSSVNAVLQVRPWSKAAAVQYIVIQYSSSLWCLSCVLWGILKNHERRTADIRKNRAAAPSSSYTAKTYYSGNVCPLIPRWN